MKDIDVANKELKKDLTIVLVKENDIITSNKKGVSPMIDFIRKGINLNGYSLADKVVGKAVAMLFVKVGIKEVYAKVISKPALEYLKSNGIIVTYEKITDNIINREGNGMCPMEETVLNETDYNKAYELILEKLAMLRGN